MTVTPFALKDAPILINTVYPAQKISIESQKERKAGSGQTLTPLASYWKGRKPLIMVRSLVLGSLLPCTTNPEKDLEIYEYLMGIHDDQFILRDPKISTKDLFEFACENARFLSLFDFARDDEGYVNPKQPASWKKGLDIDSKQSIKLAFLKSLSYEKKVGLTSRPEQIDADVLYETVWDKVNAHYAEFGINVSSMDELVEQFGLLRFGRRPRVGDTFAGGGSIPFEASRMGCDSFASDLNPIACMLNWGNKNIIGATPDRRTAINKMHADVDSAIDEKITELGIEHNSQGDRAKVYLYCIEVVCPETGYKVPVAPSWVISSKNNVCAVLTPNHATKSFNIDVITGATKAQMAKANVGTYQKQNLVYELNGRTYTTPMKTIRGDYKDDNKVNQNRLRPWGKLDFMPQEDDILQERLYAIQWYTADSLGSKQPKTFFAAVTPEDLAREEKVNNLVAENIADWQEKGWVPDMEIEAGYNTSQPIRERGWHYWHQLFNARQLLFFATWRSCIPSEFEAVELVRVAKNLGYASKLCIWDASRDTAAQVFTNQSLNTMFAFPCRSSNYTSTFADSSQEIKSLDVKSADAINGIQESDMWVTDPPYADAVHYHEITEFFIAWLRKSPPKEFNEWTWDSRRALAIKGDGKDFREGMVGAYSNMAKHMPDNGTQCVMFTHQDTSVWSDMVNIFWASGLQVTAAWYIATETTSELKKGGYVQGTVILMLKKRPAGENHAFRQRVMPQIKNAVKTQVESMMHLNSDVKENMGAPVFNDADLQMAGYAAALNVLTQYTHIDGKDATKFVYEPKVKGKLTVIDEIVIQAAETANSLLTPEGVSSDLWASINGIQRFYLRMLDIESAGVFKLDNYQNFAKAFSVKDYNQVMQSVKQNEACLKQPNEFGARDLSDNGEIGPTWLGAVVVAIQQTIQEVKPKQVLGNLANSEGVKDYAHARPNLEAIARYLSKKCSDADVRNAAEILANQIRNQQAF